MVSKPSNLAKLLESRLLKEHVPRELELRTHIARAKNLLKDAQLSAASLDGRYNNAYSAAHGLALAAFKMKGYRPDDSGRGGHRQILFQALTHVVPAVERDCPVFEKAHDHRNKAEYLGEALEIQASAVDALIGATKNLAEEVDLMFKAWRQANTGTSLS